MNNIKFYYKNIIIYRTSLDQSIRQVDNITAQKVGTRKYWLIPGKEPYRASNPCAQTQRRPAHRSRTHAQRLAGNDGVQPDPHGP